MHVFVISDNSTYCGLMIAFFGTLIDGLCFSSLCVIYNKSNRIDIIYMFLVFNPQFVCNSIFNEKNKSMLLVLQWKVTNAITTLWVPIKLVQGTFVLFSLTVWSCNCAPAIEHKRNFKQFKATDHFTSNVLN